MGCNVQYDDNSFVIFVYLKVAKGIKFSLQEKNFVTICGDGC